MGDQQKIPQHRYENATNTEFPKSLLIQIKKKRNQDYIE